MKEYFYQLLRRYLAIFIRPEDRLLDLDCPTEPLMNDHPGHHSARLAELEDLSKPLPADYVLLNGTLHYLHDIQGYLELLHGRMAPDARLIITYYSALWRPLLALATRLGWRGASPEVNWLAHEDIANLLRVAGFEPIRLDNRILLPIRIPLLSGFANRFLAPLPLLRWFAVVNILMARPIAGREGVHEPSVSVIVPARNEAGNIAEIVRRLPGMGPEDELIFIEGGSTDDTWKRIQVVAREYQGPLRIRIAQQDGRGKGDAVRKGFALAERDILMILDADMTVPPEDLPKFYRALTTGKGEFINGSRLVYPMEREAMRFLNLLGNKFFALGFSFVLGQRFKDTLCGTKVLSRQNYERLAAHRGFFGEFDPFGDFDLIFGAARMGLQITEIPVAYRERTYGTTNISRWTHGVLLLRMLIFASLRLKFV